MEPASIHPTAVRTDLGAIFVSLELSRSTWLITSLSPGSGEKMSKHVVASGNVAELLDRFEQLQHKARLRTGTLFPIVTIQEAGLDGFWIHRVLEANGIESHVVDAASIATSRRRRRAKTDKIDGEALTRTLLAFKRGEPRVCAMVKAPDPKDEDRRRICRERKVLIAERVRHVNRVKGLLFAQGVSGYQSLRKDRRRRLEELQTGDGRELPKHLKAQINRELDRLDLLLEQIAAVESERNSLLSTYEQPAVEATSPAAMLLSLKGIGAEFAAVLWTEALSRRFDNRRQIAAYAGLTPTPLDERDHRSRTGCLKSRKPSAAHHDDSTVLVVARQSASISAQPLVCGSGSVEWWTLKESRDSCPGAQTPYRAVEVCHCGCCHRGGCHEDCVTTKKLPNTQIFQD